VLLAQRKDFDPDVQDGSGWTPLMIAVSLKEGDDLVNLFLNKGADVNQTSKTNSIITRFPAKYMNFPDFSGQVCYIRTST
jgi:26S proteasome non-ATPase regulatory subunit 10